MFPGSLKLYWQLCLQGLLAASGLPFKWAITELKGIITWLIEVISRLTKSP